MKKFVNLILFAVFLSTPILAQSKYPFTGMYTSKTGELDVLQLSNKKIKFLLWLTNGRINPNIGQSEGIIELNGNDAVDSITCYENEPNTPCILHFHFHGTRVSVDVADAENCGWGWGVYSDRSYVKLANRKPDFNSSNGHVGAITYKVLTPKSFFYQDSLLSKPQKSYLVKGDKIDDMTPWFENHNIAIYTEIYNKKRFNLTYGWIAKKDLMQVPDK